MKLSFLRLAMACIVAPLLVIPTVAGEQRVPNTEDYISLLRVDLRARKAQLVMESMELTVDEAGRFVAIYADYDKELSKINAERISVIRDFAAHFTNMEDPKARELLKKTFHLTRKRLDLLEKTARRVEKAFSGVLAARFAQIENQLLLMIDVQINSELPLIPREILIPQAGN